MNKKLSEKIVIHKLQNGWIVGEPQSYDTPRDATMHVTFEDALVEIANRMGESGYASTVKQAQAMAVSMAEICSLAVAPKLLAIEARLNPGSENVIDLGEHKAH